MKLTYAIIPTQLGKIFVSRTEKGISRIFLTRNEGEKYLKSLRGKKDVELKKDDQGFTDLKRKFKDYFSGKKVTFPQKLDLTQSSLFQKKVWSAMQKIPHGETRSYGWLAKKVGGSKKARAVGSACGKNPIPLIIPCHRVIRKDGGLGGFIGGLHLKQKLHKIEGVKL